MRHARATQHRYPPVNPTKMRFRERVPGSSMPVSCAAIMPWIDVQSNSHIHMVQVNWD